MSNIPIADPTRFPNGVAADDSERFGGKIRIIDPSQTTLYFEDFLSIDALNDLTIYSSGGGSGSTAQEGLGGFSVNTTGTSSGNSIGIRHNREFFQATSDGKRLFFKIKFHLDDVLLTTFVAGLTEISNTPESATDSMYFFKEDGDATLKFRVKKTGGSTDESDLFDIVNDTFVTVSFIHDGNNIRIFKNDDLISIVSSDNIPTVLLMPNIFHKTTTNSAKALTTDFFLVGKDR